jgi:hypothetical protein
MLVFVIPLKSVKFSKSWERVCALFERTVKSVCNQTYSDFRVIVVCNEKPSIEFDHPNLEYIQVDYPEAKESELINTKLTDRGRKVLRGLIEAKKFNPSHAMAVDADDCISKKIAEFVKGNPSEPGWFVDKGYKYIEGKKTIYVKRNNFYRMCGSCNIIRYDLNNLPENPEYNRGYGYYKLWIDHEKVKPFMEQQGTPLSVLPFPGAIYILGTGDNIYGDTSRFSFPFFNRKLLSQSIRDEFGLYPIAT